MMKVVVCLLMSAVWALHQVSSQHTLRVTGDRLVELYVNGDFRALANGADHSTVDEVVLFENNDRVIAFHAEGDGWCSGILAATNNGDFLTDYRMRCSGEYTQGWQQPGFDDIMWRFSYFVADNADDSPICPRWRAHPEIDQEAKWIWTANITDAEEDLDRNVYCRGYLPVCDSSPCQNGGYCNPNGPTTICECLPGYTGAFCETHLVQDCGDHLQLAPADVPMRPGYHRYCYLDDSDINYADYTCSELLTGLPGYPTAQDLLDAGGNFGCWVLKDFPDDDAQYACVDNYQQWKQLGSCFNCKYMGVCIRFPTN